ncbi:MAG: cyclic pyranopterin monophosphate synthase MoaC [Candidatus Sumerlaeia bacterium]
MIRMIDVGGKEPTAREAVAEGVIVMTPQTAEAIRAARVPKGDVLAAARVAAIMAAKRTADILPLCHPLPLDVVEVGFELGADRVCVMVTTRATARTGVEMEALTGAAAALLTIYDMCKGLDRAMTIGQLRLLRKTGGKTGDYIRSE